MYTIYGLIDPRDHRFYYVGCTQNLTRRYREHRSGSGSASAKIRNRELKALGLKPVLVILRQAATAKDAAEAETFTMRLLRSHGRTLTNKDWSGLKGASELTRAERKKQARTLARKERQEVKALDRADRLARKGLLKEQFKQQRKLLRAGNARRTP